MGPRIHHLLPATLGFVASCSLVTPLGGLSGGQPSTDAGATPVDGGQPSTDAGATAPLDGARPSTDAGATPLDANAPDVVAADAFRQAVLLDGPRAYFRFEDTGGTSCANEVTGTSIQCVYPTSAITFGADGAAAPRKGVHLLDRAATINIFGAMDFAGEQPFTVEAWISLDEVVVGSVTFMNQDPQGPRTSQNQFIFDDKRLRTEAWAAGTLFSYTLSPLPVSPSTWYHVAYEYSPTAMKDVLYVNAAEGESHRLSSAARIAPTAPLVLGGFKGVIDDVAIFAKALTPAQIAAHYTAR